MKMIRTLVSLAVLAPLACSSLTAAAKVGEVAPDFTLASAEGKTHSLSDFKGKFVVLEWVNHGCPFVKKHYVTGNMQATQKAVTKEGIVWLSICSSAPGNQGYMTAEAALAATKKAGVESTAYLIDAEGTVGKLYGAKRTPEVFIIDPEGKVVYHGAIDSIASARESDVGRAQNFVMAALDNIKADEPIAQAQTQPYGCSIKYAK